MNVLTSLPEASLNAAQRSLVVALPSFYSASTMKIVAKAPTVRMLLKISCNALEKYFRAKLRYKHTNYTATFEVLVIHGC